MDTDDVPFGKYQGMDINVLLADRGYCMWLVRQDWLEERYPAIYGMIVDQYDVDVSEYIPSERIRQPKQTKRQAAAEAHGAAVVAASIATSVRQRMIEKQSAAAAVFEARWTLNALLREAPDLYEALQDQLGMFHASLGAGTDEQIVAHGEAMCRGWAAAIAVMEKSNIAADAIHIGEFGECVVAIGRMQKAPGWLREQYGDGVVYLCPREVAMLYLRLDVARALKAEWPDAELTEIREKENA